MYTRAMKKLYQPFTALIFTVLMLAAVNELVERDWSHFFVVIQTILLSLVPTFLYKKYGIATPRVLRVGIVAFLFGTLFLGEIGNFYDNYFWWDFALHAFAGLGLMLISMILLMIFYRETELRSNPFMTVLLAFSFTMMMAVLWELYEFAIDQMQWADGLMQPSNEDTMTDFVAAILGAVVVGIPGYKYLQNRRHNSNMVVETIEEAKQANA